MSAALSAARHRYRIGDEPTGGALAPWAVDPIWPLFGAMFGGAWLAWPWFIVNGAAMGSPTRRREIGWAVAGLVVSVALVLTMVAANRAHLLPKGSLRYLLTLVVAWRLAVSYALYSLQSPVHELHVHFRGATRNGLLVVLASAFVPWSRILGKWESVLSLVLG